MPNKPGSTELAAEIQRSLGRIEGQLNAIGSSFAQHIADDAANFKEVKLNISIMQRKLYTYSGVFIALGYALMNTDKLLAFIR